MTVLEVLPTGPFGLGVASKYLMCLSSVFNGPAFRREGVFPDMPESPSRLVAVWRITLFFCADFYSISRRIGVSTKPAEPFSRIACRESGKNATITHMHNEDNDEARSRQLELALERTATLADIESRQPDSKEIWYGHSILTSTLFPATPPPEGTDFVSKDNNTVEYILEAGIDSITRSREFPYGKYPRLLMAWMAKQIRSKSSVVDPQTHSITIPSMYQLCEQLGIPRGGKSVNNLQDQLRRLLYCHISIRRKTGFVGGGSMYDSINVQMVKAVRFVDNEKNRDFSGAKFILTDEVWDRLARESAPFDTRAMQILLSRRSVLPYDLYVWLTGTMKNLRHDLPLDWDWLHDRFGDSITDRNNFKKKFRDALNKVREVYPAVRVDTDRHGVILHPSPTSVPARAERRALGA